MTYIASLYGTNAQTLEPTKSLFHLVLQKGCIAPSLRMSDEAHPLLQTITRDLIHIKIGVRLEIANLLALSPTGIPALGQHTAETMTGCKIHITLHVLSSSAMRRAHLPGVLLFVNTPPDTDITTWLYPRCIFNL